MAKFRKKPVAVEARRIEDGNIEEMVEWANAMRIAPVARHDGTGIFIKTPQGEIQADVGAWIVRSVLEEIYPIRDDVFRATYEAVEEEPPKPVRRRSK